MGSPKGQCEGDEVDGLPDEFEEKQRDHLHRVAEAEEGSGSEASEQGRERASGLSELGGVMQDAGPDVGAESSGEDEVAEAESVEAEEGQRRLRGVRDGRCRGGVHRCVPSSYGFSMCHLGRVGTGFVGRSS